MKTDLSFFHQVLRLVEEVIVLANHQVISSAKLDHATKVHG